MEKIDNFAILLWSTIAKLKPRFDLSLTILDTLIQLDKKQPWGAEFLAGPTTANGKNTLEG